MNTDATTSTITLPFLDDMRAMTAPLYHRYPGQHAPQKGFLELSEDGTVRVDWNSEIGNAVPFYVHHRRTLRWTLNEYLSGRALSHFLGRDDVQALLERIHAGHSIEWDGNNNIGKLDADAQTAEDDLAWDIATLNEEGEVASVVDVGEYVSLLPVAADGSVHLRFREAVALGIDLPIDGPSVISQHTDEETLKALAEQIELDADAGGFILSGNVLYHLQDAIADLADFSQPDAVEEAAARHVDALETDGIQAEPSDAFERWDSVSLPMVPGASEETVRRLLSEAIARQLTAQCADV